MKYAKSRYDTNGFQVPDSVTIADGVTLGWNCRSVGQRCVIGEEVELESSIGDDVRIGAKSDIDRCTIGDNIRIGSGCVIRDSTINDGVAIGNNVVIGAGCTLRKNVHVPDNWEIPGGAIVNPGLRGFPVVLYHQPKFKCNVQGSLTAGGGNGW